MGAAAGCAIIGGGFGIAESRVHGKAVAADPTTTMRSTVDQQHRDPADHLAIGAYVGLSVGGAALAASVIVFLLDGTRGETHDKQHI